MAERKNGGILVLCLVALIIILSSSFVFAAGPKYGGTLNIGVRIPQFNMLDVRYGTLETMIPSSGMIYDPFFNWGPDGYKSQVPALVTRIETEDNKVWFIHLRKGVKFHNGREMTAEDVKINFDWRIKTPEGWRPVKFRELIKYLKSAEVVDKYTVKVTLEKPFSPLRRILTYAMRGIGPGPEVTAYGKKIPPIFWLDGNMPAGRNTGEMAKLQLAQIGVTLNLQLLDRGMWFKKILRDPKFEWDLAGYGVGFGLDPTMGFMYFATDSGVTIDGKSVGGYSNPELDRLLEKVEASSDKEQILKYMQEGEKILLKDVASIPLLVNQQLIGFNKRVKGVQFNNTGHIYPTNTWANMWIEE